MKWLSVALLIFSVFTPAVFAQTAKQKELPGCIEIISGTERHLQCENVITPTAEQTGEKSLLDKKGGKARAKRLETPEQRKASPVYFLEVVPGRQIRLEVVPVVPGRQIRDFEDSPEGPIISVAR